MRSYFIWAVAFLFFVLVRAYALVPVEDIPNEINTKMTEINSAETLIKQITMVQNQLEQLENEQKNLEGLTNPSWDNAESDLTQLGNAMNQTHGLAYSSSSVSKQYQQAFPGYSAQPTTDYSSSYKGWVQTNQATMNGVLDQINLSYEEEQQEAVMDQDLDNQAKNPMGNMQALEIGNEIAGEQIAQLQKVKSTLMAQTNAQAEYYAYQSQKDAAKQQSIDAVVKTSSDTFPTYQNNASFGLLPSFGTGE